MITKYIQKLTDKQFTAAAEGLSKQLSESIKKLNEESRVWREGYQERQNELTKHLHEHMTQLKEMVIKLDEENAGKSAKQLSRIADILERAVKQ